MGGVRDAGLVVQEFLEGDKRLAAIIIQMASGAVISAPIRPRCRSMLA